MPGPSGASASASQLQVVETAHTEMVHDCQLDFYGKRLATCSSDRTVKIFDVADNAQTLVDTLRGHDGPVWSVAWGHPKYGSILASASYDGKVIIWRENGAKWEKIKEHTLHGASVNSIAWAPHELGPQLACASSDGKVSVLAFNNDGTWDASLFAAHSIGVNAVSWAPAVQPSSLLSPQQTGQQQQQSPYVRKFATGGCDNLVKIWGYNAESQTWTEEQRLEGHSDWVRDVAFAPGIGLPRTYLASCGQDRTVLVWTQDGPGQAWNKRTLNPAPYLSGGNATEGKFPDVVWRVSWSVTGNVLAVAAGDGKVSLWKENLKGGEWECVSEVAA